jgi:hypothetical protein
MRDIEAPYGRFDIVKAKITPPIVLFVIDNSGSMYQSIFHNLKYGNNPQVLS